MWRSDMLYIKPIAMIICDSNNNLNNTVDPPDLIADFSQIARDLLIRNYYLGIDWNSYFHLDLEYRENDDLDLEEVRYVVCIYLPNLRY